MLDDGTVFAGEGFGYPATVFGEVVFNTGMVGYPETLTDPSYAGQIISLTSPLVGNYGVPDPSEADESGISRWFESDRIQVRGLAIYELSEHASHWKTLMTLDQWMHNERVPGISGIDTRQLTKQLRADGVRMGALAVSENEIDDAALAEGLRKAQSYNSEHFVDVVSADSVQRYAAGGCGYARDPVQGTVDGQDGGHARDDTGMVCDTGMVGNTDMVEDTSATTNGRDGRGNGTVVVIDTGSKNAIFRNILRMGYDIVRVPWNTPADQILRYDPRGVVISNGPGDPQHCPETIGTAKTLIKRGIPTLGICLGAQIIGLAGGASTYKLKYGHRGQNKPCIDKTTGQIYVTSQNHGYCIDPVSLPGSEFDMWFVNADDDTVEGIRHRDKPVIAVQFHPEASPGPYDCMFVFERLKSLMEGDGSAKD